MEIPKQEPKKDLNVRKKTTEKNQKEKVYLGIIVGLVVLCGGLTWKVFNNKTEIQNIGVQKDTAENERNEVKAELEEMLAQYDELETDNEELSAEVLAQKEHIQDLLDQVKKNKGNLRLIRKYKTEVTTLRTIMKGYVVSIDSLNTLNVHLSSENTQMKGELSTSRNENENLNTQNKTLSGIALKASLLRLTEIDAEGIKLRSSGRQSSTSRAEKVELFKTCFTVNKNTATKAGVKEVFLRILSPDGDVVATRNNKLTTVKGKKIVYSASRSFEYDDENSTVCIYANNDEALKTGAYQVEIYEEGELIGTSEVILK